MIELKGSLRPSPGKGIGVFSMIDMPAQALVWFKLAGVREYSKEEFLSLPPEYAKFGGLWRRDNTFYGPDDFTLLNISIFLNHSADPNLEKLEDGLVPMDDSRSYWRTRRAVQTGDEITIDYIDLWSPGYGCRVQSY